MTLQPPLKGVHEYHREKEARKKETNPRPNEKVTSVSKSKLAAGVYEGIRKAHSEEEKTKARQLRILERQTNEEQKLREKANLRVPLFKIINLNPPADTTPTTQITQRRLVQLNVFYRAVRDKYTRVFRERDEKLRKLKEEQTNDQFVTSDDQDPPKNRQ